VAVVFPCIFLSGVKSMSSYSEIVPYMLKWRIHYAIVKATRP